MSSDELKPKNFFDYIGEAEAKNTAAKSLKAFKEDYFQFGEYELKKYREFVAKQLATNKVRYGTCGGSFSITFCPTGIGMEVWATCYDTDAKESLVDLENF